MAEKKIIIGNWKMNLGIDKSVALAKELHRLLNRPSVAPEVETVICPSFLALYSVGKVIEGSRLLLGVQDIFWHDSGPYTGEISASSVAALGCRVAIVGHSERRVYLNENDAMANQKVQAALVAGLIPILCVGETYDQRRDGLTDMILATQVIEGLKGLTMKLGQRIIIAYEPVWVIGSGRAIEPAEALHAAQVIRQALIDLFPLDVVRNQTRVIYGGSVDENNIKQFTGMTEIHGALVGASSLVPEKFAGIVRNC